MFILRLLGSIFNIAGGILNKLPNAIKKLIPKSMFNFQNYKEPISLFDSLTLGAVDKTKNDIRGNVLQLAAIWKLDFWYDLVNIGGLINPALSELKWAKKQWAKTKNVNYLTIINSIEGNLSSMAKKRVNQIIALEVVNPNKKDQNGGATTKDTAKIRKNDYRGLNMQITNERNRLKNKLKYRKGNYKYTSFPNAPDSWLNNGEWFRQNKNGNTYLTTQKNSMFKVKMSDEYFLKMAKSIRPGKVLWDGPWFYKRTNSLKTRSGKRMIRLYGEMGKKYK